MIIPLVSRDNPEFSPGNVIVTNDDKFLSVKFEVTEVDWNIDMIYLQVGPLDLVPLEETGAYPAFWDFNHQYADIPVASYTFELAMEDLDDCFEILAQVRIADREANKVVLWTEGINPDWIQGPYHTHYCAENCSGSTTDTDQTGDKPRKGKGNDKDKDDDRDDDEDDDKDGDDD